MRRLGNQKPRGILELERTVWTAVFGISSGKHSAVTAFLKLHDGWVNENWETKLSMEDRHFFARGQYAHWKGVQSLLMANFLIDAQVPYSALESLCDSQISRPVPADWPCVAGRNFVTILNDMPGPTASDSGTPVGSVLGGGPSSRGEMDVVEGDGGEGGASGGLQTPQPNNEQADNSDASRRSERLEGQGEPSSTPMEDQPNDEQTNNDDAPRRSKRLEGLVKPNGTPIEAQPNNEQSNNGDAPRRSKRLEDQEGPNGAPNEELAPLKQKRPRKAEKLPRKSQKASVRCDDDDDDDVVVLAYTDICIQSTEERRRLEEEIIIKVEEDEVRAP